MIPLFHNFFPRASFRAISDSMLVLAPLEKYLQRLYGAGDMYERPIFIIGAPRTGSTLLYQLLTYYFNFSYFSNLTSFFYRAPVTGAVLSGKLFRSQKHASFKSQFGHTKGMAGPSEGSQFWYRWLPPHAHYLDENDINERIVSEIRMVVTALNRCTGRPVIFKHLNVGLRLRAFKRIFPKACFILCTRNRLQTAQSILNARKKVFKDKQQWFSLKPKAYPELRDLPFHEQIAGQIIGIEKHMADDITLFPESQVMRMDYAELCRNPAGAMADFRDFFADNGLHPVMHPGLPMPGIAEQKGRSVEQSDYDRLRTLLGDG